METLKEQFNRVFAKIKDAKVRFKELMTLTQDPDLWKDPERARDLLREENSILVWLEDYANIQSMMSEMEVMKQYPELSSEEEINSISKDIKAYIEKVEMASTLTHEEDFMDSIIQINSGAGGTESQDWAQMLLRMYVKWADSHGHKVRIAHIQEGDVTGIKSVTIEIIGRSYGYLKGENGVHRLIRVSPYNAQGKRMTSFASVFVTPLIDDTIEVYVDPSKITWEFFRSGGAGGQNVNKVETGVRLRYADSEGEIIVENTETRKQLENRNNAMRLLKSKLYDRALKKKLEEKSKVEANKKKIEWGSQIRSYVFDDRRVKDHRTNYQTSDVDSVMDGNIDGFIRAYLLDQSNF